MFGLESSSASSEIPAFPSCVFKKNGDYKVCLKEEGFVDLEEQNQRIRQITICFLENFFTDPNEVIKKIESPDPTTPGTNRAYKAPPGYERDEAIKNRYGKLVVKGKVAKTLTISQECWRTIFNEKFHKEDYQVRVLLEIEEPKIHQVFHLKGLSVDRFDVSSDYELKFRMIAYKMEQKAINYALKKRWYPYSIQMPKVTAAVSKS